MTTDADDVFGWATEEAPEPAVQPVAVEAEVQEDPLEKAGLPATIDSQPVAAMLQLFQQECNLTAQRARTITIIRDAETNAKAADWAVQTKKLMKRLEELRKRVVGPYNDFLREVNGFFKLYTEPLGQAETYLARLLGNYRQFQENEARRIKAEQEKEARELQAKQEAEAKAAAEKDVHYDPVPVVAPAAPEVPKVTRVAGGSTSQAKSWTFEIEDETKIPREYLMVDEKKIRTAVKGGVRNIEGVKIFEDYTTKIRA